MSTKETEKTTVAVDSEDLANDKPTKKGGKGARSKRADNRQKFKNKNVDASAQNAALSRLGLTETNALAVLKPTSSTRPGGVHINLLAYNENVSKMLTRLITVAQRPLAMILTPGNIQQYRFVCAYIAYVRVAAAQDANPGIVGNQPELASTVSYDNQRKAEGRCQIIPRFLAWSLSNIGTFEHSGQKVVPLLPLVDHPSAAQAASGNITLVSRYIKAQGENEIPQADRIPARLLASVLPNISIRNNQFVAATVAAWQSAVPTVADWTTFDLVNSACMQQDLCVRDFSLLTATGSAAQIIRFPRSIESNASIEYYCLSAETSQVERAGLIMRLGVDIFLPDEHKSDRFIGNPATALLAGYDIPSAYVTAQLTMLNKPELRND